MRGRKLRLGYEDLVESMRTHYVKRVMNGMKPCIMRMVSAGSPQTKQSHGPVRDGVEVGAANCRSRRRGWETHVEASGEREREVSSDANNFFSLGCVISRMCYM